MTKKEQKFDLISNDEKTLNLLNKFKANSKYYQKILSVLKILGNFNGKTEVFISDIVEDEDYSCVKFWCFDQSDNIFTFSSQSTNKNDLNIIEKHIDDIVEIFNVSLAKKFKLTDENILLLKDSIKKDFKFGRIITDTQNFCSVFLSNDVVYQVIIGNNSNKNIIDLKNLLTLLNEMNNIPTFAEFINLFHYLIEDLTININFVAFKDFNKIGEVKFNSEKQLIKFKSK